MSEFYFDYKCIAMSERLRAGTPDRALDFYLYQDYSAPVRSRGKKRAGGGMCVQIYIPRDKQAGFCAARLYFVPNAVEVPRIDCIAPQVFTISEAAHAAAPEHPFVPDTNSVFFNNDSLSGCGVLALIDGEDVNAPVKAQNTYKFSVNYTKKETISYVIDEGKKGFKLRIAYPRLRAPIDVCVIKKRGAKPVLIGDRKGDDACLKDKNGNRIVFTLEPTGRDNNVIDAVLDAAGTIGNDFRLVFSDFENNRYYLLADESEYTIEDKKQRKAARKVVRKQQTKARCPYCNDALTDNSDKGKKTGVFSCDGKFLTANADGALKGKHTTVCKRKIFECAEGAKEFDDVELGLPLSPRPVIPPEAFTLPSVNIATVGFPESGKSMYLASVMNMGAADGTVSSDPFVLRRIAETFDKSKAHGEVSEVKFDAVSIDADGKAKPDDGYEKRRASAAAYDGKVKLRYALSVGDKAESNTPPSELTRLEYNPVGFKLGGMGFVYFYDIPGEYFINPVRTIRSIDVADGFIAVIDGDPKAKDALADTVAALGNIKKLASRNIDISNMPIAVVFCKHDKKLSDYLPASRRDEEDMCFDENCHVVREDTLALMPENGMYAGSELERHIDRSSYELEHYLKSRDAAEYNKLIGAYKNIKFFTCSALGSDACLAEPKAGNKEILFRPRRIRVELPLVWLMYAVGLIEE